MFLKSIRWRLQIWYGVILVAVLAGFGFTAYQLERGRQFRRLDEEVMRRVRAVANTMRPPPGQPRSENAEPGPHPLPPGPRPPRDRPMDGRRPPGPGPGPGPEHRPRLQLNQIIDENDSSGFYYVAWRPDGEEFARSTNAPAIVPRPERGFGSGPQPPRLRGEFYEGRFFTHPGDMFVIGRSISGELHELRRTGWTLAAIGGVVLLLGLAGGWILTGRAIRPIDDISATAAQIASGDLSRRISTADTDSELGRLASVLNSTFSRLETAFAQQRQFTSDAAHELRTPVSVMLTQTQLVLNRERTAEEYREAISACQRAAQRMRGLIESLLELARLDAGQEKLRKVPLSLAAVAADAVEFIRPLAAERGIVFETELAEARCSGDSDRLAQVAINLLGNAVNYNRENGSIRVVTRSENGFAVLTVTDSGEGISLEHLPFLFERFYRVDAARTAARGRTGLGLAIVKAIVTAHGGSVDVSSREGQGSTFTVRLPAS